MHRRAHSLAHLLVLLFLVASVGQAQALPTPRFARSSAGPSPADSPPVVSPWAQPATFSGERTRYPFVETAVGSAALFAALEAVEWERRCG